MANEEHVEILSQGVEVWNKWREDNPDITPDLSGAILNGASLEDVSLEFANLRDADLSFANLIRANFPRADFFRANLLKADLREANLIGAKLINTNLRVARLTHAFLVKADITGAKLYGAARDFWEIEGIKCDYVLWDSDRKNAHLKTAISTPENFERLYKWRLLDDFERLIERSIEFPPEYKQAGVSILNYFSEILHKKYPESDATVQIKQDGLKVSMIIDPAEGEHEIIEKTLNDYGLVITGQMPPEEFTDDKHLIIELKSELRIAHARIGMQKDLLLDKSAQVDKLLSIVGNAVQTPHHVHINTQASGGNTINAHNIADSKLTAGNGNKL